MKFFIITLITLAVTQINGAPTLSAKCVEPAEPGTCSLKLPRFYYDTKSGECKEFRYGGCRGNNNRFGTKDFCEKECLKSSTPSVAPPKQDSKKSTPTTAPVASTSDNKKNTPTVVTNPGNNRNTPANPGNNRNTPANPGNNRNTIAPIQDNKRNIPVVTPTPAGNRINAPAAVTPTVPQKKMNGHVVTPIPEIIVSSPNSPTPKKKVSFA